MPITKEEFDIFFANNDYDLDILSKLSAENGDNPFLMLSRNLKNIELAIQDSAESQRVSEIPGFVECTKIVQKEISQAALSGAIVEIFGVFECFVKYKEVFKDHPEKMSQKIEEFDVHGHHFLENISSLYMREMELLLEGKQFILRKHFSAMEKEQVLFKFFQALANIYDQQPSIDAMNIMQILKQHVNEDIISDATEAMSPMDHLALAMITNIMPSYSRASDLGILEEYLSTFGVDLTRIRNEVLRMVPVSERNIAPPQVTNTTQPNNRFVWKKGFLLS